MILKTKINLSITVFIVLIICFIVFLIYPLFSEIKNISQDLISQKQDLISFQTKTEDLEKFQILYQEIKPDLEKINTLFIDSELPVDFINFLEKTSGDCKVLIKISLALSTEIKADPWPSLTFQITSISSFPNFLKFLEKLESSVYLIEIQNLNITRLSEAELKSKEFEGLVLGDVKTTLSIKVFTK